VAKFNSLNKECLALGFEEGFGRLLRLNSSEAFKIKEQEMSSTANMLAAGGVDLTAQIGEEEHGCFHGQKEVSE
jgi:hypothetical protein